MTGAPLLDWAAWQRAIDRYRYAPKGRRLAARAKLEALVRDDLRRGAGRAG